MPLVCGVVGYTLDREKNARDLYPRELSLGVASVTRFSATRERFHGEPSDLPGTIKPYLARNGATITECDSPPLICGAINEFL